MWRDENKRPSVCHRSTRRKVSRGMGIFAICICPHLPHSPFDRAAPPPPPASAFEYLAVNVDFVS